MTKGGITSEVADFVTATTFDGLPASVLKRAKRSILDGLGLAVLGSQSRASKLASAHIDDLDVHNARCTVLGSKTRTAPRFASFLNGIAIHADDFDDTQLAANADRVYGLLTHPTAPVLPAALAAAESGEMTGRALITAYAVGVEVECKLAEAISPRHYKDGFHSTGTMGTMGAAAALANLKDLRSPVVATALSIAASQSAGLRENFGSMTKPFHAGRASESGTVAVDLAERGFSAALDILEAERGLFKAMGGSFSSSAIHEKLGNPWIFDSPGISIKPYPSGSLTHPAMGALLDLLEENTVPSGAIRRIRVGANSDFPSALIHHRPASGLEAKFSMEFCLAIIALERRAGPDQFTVAKVNDSATREMVERVELFVDARADAAGTDTMSSYLTVELTDGTELETTAEFAKGSPRFPLTDDEVVSKFLLCTGADSRDARRLARIAKAVLEWEDYGVEEVLLELNLACTDG